MNNTIITQLLSHINCDGKPIMVDVSYKNNILRIAKAQGFITLHKTTVELILKNDIAKGNVLTTAEIAGINAAKRTCELIPLCHNLQLTNIAVNALLKENGIQIESIVKAVDKTGVEMEALVAVNIALLTIYDMCKAVDKKMEIINIKLIEKYKSRVK